MMIGRSDGNYGDTNIVTREKQNWYVHWGRWKDQILEAVEILVFLRDVYNDKKKSLLHDGSLWFKQQRRASKS